MRQVCPNAGSGAGGKNGTTRAGTVPRWLGLGLILATAAWAWPAQAQLLDPALQPKFQIPLPDAKANTVDLTGGQPVTMAVRPITQNLGLINPATGLADFETELFAYGVVGEPNTFTYPGPTFEARSGTSADVTWLNQVDGYTATTHPSGAVDTTLHMALCEDLDRGDLGQASANAVECRGRYADYGIPIVTHLHGGHSESASDGLPEAWYTPDDPMRTEGLYYVKQNYTYDNDQEAATLWYHDHALGITRLNVYAGMAGFYLLRDAHEDSLNLPSGDYEVPIVIQDRMFTVNGELFMPSGVSAAGSPAGVLPEFFGDFILVNGAPWPVLDVEPTTYRLRFLNGSDSRFYELTLPGGPRFVQIGVDQGLLPGPVEVRQLVLGPGERADVLMDFSKQAGKTLILQNSGRSPYPFGTPPDPNTTGQIMAFRVGQTAAVPPYAVPATLRGPITPPTADFTRQLGLVEGIDVLGRLKPELAVMENGVPLAKKWDDPLTEDPALDDVEMWEIYNFTPDTHPIHLHLVAFQVIERQRFRTDPTGAAVLVGQPRAPAANEAGWKDTVRMNPGEVTRVIATWDRPGRYVWHCHILSHEDHEMMRPICVDDPQDQCTIARPPVWPQ